MASTPRSPAWSRRGWRSGDPSPSAGRERHLYQITDAGQRAFSAYLEEPTAPAAVRNEFKLKFFLAWDQPPAVRRRLVAEYRQQQRELLSEFVGSKDVLEAALASGRPPEELEGLLSTRDPERQLEAFVMMQEQVIAEIETRLAWCDAVEARLGGRGSPAGRSGGGGARRPRAERR